MGGFSLVNIFSNNRISNGSESSGRNSRLKKIFKILKLIKKILTFIKKKR